MSYTLKDLRLHFQALAQNLVNNCDKSDIFYDRGRYKGLMFAVNTVNYLLLRSIMISKKELINEIYREKYKVVRLVHREPMYIRGIADSIEEIVKYILELDD